jgi:hypothetical protein
LTKAVELDLSLKLPNPNSTLLEVFAFFKDPFITIFGCILAFTMTVSIGTLFGVQTRNILYDITTLEGIIYTEEERKKINSGKDKIKNYKSLMGESIVVWFLPVNSNKDKDRDKAQAVKNYISLTDQANEFDENIHINLNLQD